MRALPSSLDAARPRAAEIYASGWRPPVPDGPSRDELADLLATATSPSLAGAVSSGHRQRSAS
jgi:hypothetical protein